MFLRSVCKMHRATGPHFEFFEHVTHALEDWPPGPHIPVVVHHSADEEDHKVTLNTRGEGLCSTAARCSDALNDKVAAARPCKDVDKSMRVSNAWVSLKHSINSLACTAVIYLKFISRLEHTETIGKHL